MQLDCHNILMHFAVSQTSIPIYTSLWFQIENPNTKPTIFHSASLPALWDFIFFRSSDGRKRRSEMGQKKGVRTISQAAFDELVRENMEDLGMDPAEALEDALQTLTLQGVDLSGTPTFHLFPEKNSFFATKYRCTYEIASISQALSRVFLETAVLGTIQWFSLWIGWINWILIGGALERWWRCLIS